eukprot:TRINITY_DN599_c0_g3_i1.p2 TRINITY_DN599_c0_g3~~TRINITY_DN599_c0_g3_i1.p2  ORF type:complete len:349 (+),score=140.32 TRINITY_DN599_c0_g3_i1:48-1049(+)
MLKTAMLLAMPCLALAAGFESERAQFEAFKAQYGKTYKSAAEEETRFSAFRASLTRVRASQNPTHGVTKFSDLTPQEFKKMYLTRKPSAAPQQEEWDGKCTACERFPEVKGLKNDTAWDWTTKGAVTKVKNQGQCGSCWSFGTTGDIEGTWFLAGHALTSLSEQELVSCDKTDDGCNGGLQEDAFAWVMKRGGLVAEETYPYHSGDGISGTCKETKTTPIVASIKSWYQVSKSAAGEAGIATQLPQVGPITIGINAGPMQDYRGGIDNPAHCPGAARDLDHAVLIVGFGSENGVDYWKIKNSWAASWGEEGYYRIVRGVNKCGVATDAVHSRV